MVDEEVMEQIKESEKDLEEGRKRDVDKLLSDSELKDEDTEKLSKELKEKVSEKHQN